jgi:hypothetical protein
MIGSGTRDGWMDRRAPVSWLGCEGMFANEHVQGLLETEAVFADAVI